MYLTLQPDDEILFKLVEDDTDVSVDESAEKDTIDTAANYTLPNTSLSLKPD
jgi:hypothetical protein